MIDEMCFVDSAINGKESNKVIINCRHQSTQRFLLEIFGERTNSVLISTYANWICLNMKSCRERARNHESSSSRSNNNKLNPVNTRKRVMKMPLNCNSPKC